MATWTEADYTRRAAEVAREFTTSRRPLNDLCEKVARDEALNPEEIRTLVRLSNVAAFQGLFKDKASQGHPDRMVEFDVGDPEAVIQRIQASVASPPQPASIHNDKLAFEVPDQMREIRLGRAFDSSKKLAAEDAPERPVRKDLAVLAARKFAAEFDVERLCAGQRWEVQMEKLASAFRKAPGYGPSFTAFVKDAFSEFGERCRPELQELARELRQGALPLSEKVAQLAGAHLTGESLELQLLGEALDARDAYLKFERGAVWLTKALR